MSKEASGPFLQASGWMIWTPPALALLLLVWVDLQGLDEPLFRFFNGLSAYTGPGLWANLTLLGDGLVCAVLLLPWLRKHPERIWGGLVGALLMFLALRGFKGMLSLPRPLAVLPEGTVTVIGPGHRKGAFPSGHTATIFLYLGTWALTERRRWLSAFLLLPAILVGISRMAVGVHWPSDVLGGAALGWVSAWFGLRVAEGTPWGMGKGSMNILSVLLLICALVLLLVDHTGYPGVLWLQRSIALACLIWGGSAAARVFLKDEERPEAGPTIR